MRINQLNPGKYVVAVSGGVDSVALLDLLSRQPCLELIVAHFNHGIRGRQSSQDARFVAGLAAGYGLPYCQGEGRLGAAASEAVARRARYAFLRQICKKYQAQAIITAHHQDDLVETALINLIRSGGIRSLTSLRSSRFGIIRPLLGSPKSRLVAYARRHRLAWREDPSNREVRFLRNYLRLKVLSGQDAKSSKRELAKLARRQAGVVDKIEDEVAKILRGGEFASLGGKTASISRYWMIMLPRGVAAELLGGVISGLYGGERLLSRQLAELITWSKVGRPGRRKAIGVWRFSLTRRQMIVEHLENC